MGRERCTDWGGCGVVHKRWIGEGVPGDKMCEGAAQMRVQGEIGMGQEGYGGFFLPLFLADG